MKDNTFKIIENGKEETFKIIELVKYKGNDYIIYADKDNEIYASSYRIINNQIEISDIDDESVYDYLDSVIGEKDE